MDGSDEHTLLTEANLAQLNDQRNDSSALTTAETSFDDKIVSFSILIDENMSLKDRVTDPGIVLQDNHRPYPPTVRHLPKNYAYC
jgi:hypothetical protein